MANIDTTSTLGALLVEHRKEILAIAARHHGRRVRIFGSVARGRANPDSDIDFLVDFEDGSSLFDLRRLSEELAGLLGRQVDVVSTGALKSRDELILAEAIDL
jgi:predicted nucleotidyltransferase